MLSQTDVRAKGLPELDVIDEISGKAGPERLLETRIHLAPGVVDVSGRGEVRRKAAERGFVVTVAGAEEVLSSPPGFDGYGERVRTQVIVARIALACPKRIGYWMGWKPRPAPRRLRIAVGAAEGIHP